MIRNLTEADYGRYRCVARSVDKKSSHVDRTIGPKTMSKPKVTTTTNRPKPGINSTVSDSDSESLKFRGFQVHRTRIVGGVARRACAPLTPVDLI